MLSAAKHLGRSADRLSAALRVTFFVGWPIFTFAAVEFQYHAPEARVVYLAGDFNDWANNQAGQVTDPAFAMTRGTNGVWHKALALEPGTHRFKYVVDGSRWVTPPGFTILDGDSNAMLRVRAADVPLTTTNFFWGLGERFDAWNLAGRVIEVWARDMAQGGPNSSYFAVPFLISAGGEGWFVTDPGGVVEPRCSHGSTSRAAEAEAPSSAPHRGAATPVVFDLRDGMKVNSTNLVRFTGTPREISRQYTQLVGRPALPPAWVFQPWYSRNSYLSAYDVERVLARGEALGLKPGVIVLEAWARSLQDFQFETNRYPNPAGWLAQLKERGVHVVLWETPSIWTSAPTYEVAKSNGWLVLNPDGTEYVTDWLENGRKIDFRQPAARAWWTELHRPLVAMGVAGFKTDGGERHPDPVFHNQMPYFYQRAVLAAFGAPLHDSVTIVTQLCKATDSAAGGDVFADRARKGAPRDDLPADVGAPFRARPGITFARSANAACAGNSLFWAGDQHAEWKSLRRVVRAGLSAALSGFPFWGPDIGGYTGNPSPELYIRWMQLGTFSPIMQFHGIPPREPWYFGDEAIRVARWCFAVRDQLQPYLREAARQASEEGTPIWRPLIWEWPDDPQARWCDDQFLLGDEILVAPLVDEFPDREVYLPAGEWRDAWSEATFTGPTNLVVNVPLEWIPVFVRSASPVRLPRPPAPLSAPAKVSLPEQPRFHPSGDETIIVTSERGGAATLHLGSGDGIMVWLNGEKVFEKIVHRTAEPDEDAVPVVLQKGDNTLRVKVIHPPAGIGANGFFLRIEHR